MIFKFIIFCFLFFPVMGSEKNLGRQNTQTEAFFNPECSHCKSQSDFYQFVKEKRDCLKKINQEECKNIPKEEKRTCSEEDGIHFSDMGSFISKCVKDTVLSYQFVFNLLWFAVENSVTGLFNSGEFNFIGKNYISIEFYKAYNSSEGTLLEKALKASGLIAGSLLTSLWTAVTDFIHNEVTAFQCYKAYAQLSIACTFLTSLFLPGSGVAIVLKTGAKTSRKIIKNKTAVRNALAKNLQLKTLTRNISAGFNDFKKITLKRSKNLTKGQRAEIQSFFQRVDKAEFVSFVNSSVSKSLSAGKTLNKKQVRNIIFIGVTTGSLGGLKLSVEAGSELAKGLIDTLATKYVDENVLTE